jgi:hypothetical protein
MARHRNWWKCHSKLFPHLPRGGRLARNPGASPSAHRRRRSTIEETLRRVVPRSTNSPRRDAPEKGQRRVLANARESEHPSLHPVPCRRRRPVRSSHAARRSRSAKTRSRGHSLLRGKYFAFPFLWLEFGTRVSIVFPNAARRFRFSLPDFRSRNVSDVLTTSVLFPRRHITSFRTQTVTPR